MHNYTVNINKIIIKAYSCTVLQKLGHFSVQICNKGKLKEGKKWWERLAKKKASGEVWVYRCRALQKPLRQIECPNSGHT